jgi:hypothetical protein
MVLKVTLAEKGDPRIRQVWTLCQAFQDAYENCDGDRDTLVSATALMLASMFAATSIKEETARFIVSEQLAELVVRQLRGFRDGSIK